MTYNFLNAQTIKVEIEDLDIKKGGNLYVALFDNAEGYPKIETAYKTKFVEITDVSMLIEFINIPSGIYAINVFHDENSNKKMDKNFLFIPKEGYGCSNNPRLLGPPTFNKTKFDFDSQQIELKIEMKY
jgi:uncharacterized protein (DUF2141 family)